MHNFTLNKDGYLTFNGLTFTQLLNDSLKANSVFTEQDLTGSNLAAIHQSLGYVFSVMMLYLNESSSESQFTESQQYRNISRVVNELGYKPIGAQTATLSFSTSAHNLSKGFYVIPQFSYVDVGGGVRYSTNEDIVFAKTTDTAVEYLSDVSSEKLLYQGSFVEHPILTATGIANEIQFLAVDDTTTIDHFNIFVYVKDLAQQKWYKWKQTDNLYMNGSLDRSYELKLNHNKRYELVFGNDINGKQLVAGEQVAIYYLRTQLKRGEVAVGSLDGRVMVAYDTTRLRQINADVNNTNRFARLTTSDLKSSIILTNTVGSTYASTGDTVEDIRRNAPSTFQSQYRLVHQNDFESFVRSNFANLVHDVHVVNNSEYLDSYIKYLYDLGLTQPTKASRPLFNQVQFSTTCNFNNIYLFVVPKTLNASMRQSWYLPPSLKQLVKSSADGTKIATCEVSFADPVYMLYDIGVPTSDSYQASDVEDTQLLIIQDDKSIKNPEALQAEIATLITDFFAIENTQLGQLVDINQLSSSILNLTDVKSITTINNKSNTRTEGIAIYYWDPVYPQIINHTTNNHQLQPFQYPLWNSASSLINKIRVIKNLRSYTAFSV